LKKGGKKFKKEEGEYKKSAKGVDWEVCRLEFFFGVGEREVCGKETYLMIRRIIRGAQTLSDPRR